MEPHAFNGPRTSTAGGSTPPEGADGSQPQARNGQSKSPASLSLTSSASPSMRGRKLLEPRTSDVFPSSPTVSRRRMSIVRSPWALDDDGNNDTWSDQYISAQRPVLSSSRKQTLSFKGQGEQDARAMDLSTLDVEPVEDAGYDSNASSSSNESQSKSKANCARLIEAMAPLVATRIVEQSTALAESWTPSLLASPRNEKIPLLPSRTELEGAVLFSDISGFSKLAERLVLERRDRASTDRNQTVENAAEKLSHMIGQGLNNMIHIINESGGDVIKFAGDAILAVFAADRFDGKLERACLVCAQVALRLSSLQMQAGKEILRVHSGVGCGRIAWYEVGGPLWHYFIAGAPVTQIGLCEHQAGPSEVVISADMRVQVEKLSAIKGVLMSEGNFKLAEICQPVAIDKHDANAKSVLLRQFVDAHNKRQGAALAKCIQAFLSTPAFYSIKMNNGLGNMATELRLCSTLFVKFRNFALDSDSPKDLQVVQYIVKELVTKIVLALEGTVCRLSVDDKGAIILLAFGIIPFAHPNDSARAVKAALLLRDGMASLSLAKSYPPSDATLSSMCTVTRDANSNSKVVLNSVSVASPPYCERGINCQIGITRGKVCVGLVGGELRCEYTMHGVLVNRAARLMSAATDFGILCDPDTYNEAKTEVEFGLPVMVTIKGEDNPILAYVPQRKITLTGSEMPKAAQGVAEDDDETDLSIIGRTAEKLEVDRALLRLKGEEPYNFVMGVQGEPGMGKSKFLSYVLKRAKRMGVHALHGFALDTEFTTSFFAWRPVVVQLITLSLGMQHNRLLVSNSSGHTMKSFGSASSGMAGAGAGAGASPADLGAAGALGSAGAAVGAGGGSGTQGKTSVRSMHNDSKGSMRGDSQRLRVSTLERTMSSRRPSKDTALSAALDMPPQEPIKSFADMTGRERLVALLGALPLESSEKYPLLAEILEGVIEKELMADTDVTQNLHGGHRVTAITDLLVEMVVMAAAKLQMRGERLILSMEDLHFMDRESLFTINQLVKATPRLVLFVSDRSFDRLSDEDQGGAHAQQESAMEETSHFKAEELNFKLKDELMSDKSNVVVLKLMPLEENEISQCMCHWLGAETIPDLAVKFIAEKSAGNPLFAQELCYLLRDNGMFQVQEGTCKVVGELDLSADYDIPNSIAALMTSNLDRIPPDSQAVLRLASVIGMIFQKNELVGVLRSLAASTAGPQNGGEEDERTAALTEAAKRIDYVLEWLVENNYLVPVQDNRPVTPGLEKYQFRHVLLKDTVCGLLGFEWKRNLHNHVARYYETRPDKDLNLLYAMAHHYYLAGNREQAKKYYELCGNDLGNAFAMQRVLECFLILLEVAPDDTPPLQRAIWERKVGEAQMHLGRVNRAEEAFYEGLRLLGLDCRDAEGVEGEGSKDEAAWWLCPCLGGRAGASETASAGGGDGAAAADDDPVDDEASNASSVSAGTRNNSTLRRRRLSVAEVRGPLLPRLVDSLPAMVELSRKIADKRVSYEEKEAAVDVLLEASRIYCLMAEMNKDRGSDEALERHLNAVRTAQAAALFPPSDDPRLASVSQRCTDALARSYAPAAVFFAGMHPETKWQRWAKDFGTLAGKIQRGGNQAETPGEFQDTDTPVLLNMRCGEYAAFQGDFERAIELLRYALWGYRFMHIENLRIETQILILTVYFFKGDLSNCNMIACELAQTTTSAVTSVAMTLSACMLALCGEDVVAVQKLEQLVRSSRTVVKEGGPLMNLLPGLLQIKDPNAFLAFSLVSWRQSKDPHTAIKAALQAGLTVLHINLTEFPLSYFHTAALVFTAIWDPVRENPQHAAPGDAIRRNLVDTMQRLLAVLRSYDAIYPACKPHTMYCVALRTNIVNALRGVTTGSFHGSLTASPEPPAAAMAPATGSALGERVRQWMGIAEKEKGEGPFYECADKAREMAMVWVQGLALLECPDDRWGAWTEAYNIFSTSEYATYELSRAHQLFVKNNLQLPPRAWLSSFMSAAEM